MNDIPPARLLPLDVYKKLRDDILAAHLKPGSILLERPLAARMGVSRTPVREALLRLESEGLTKRYPKMGMVVAELTLRDVIEAFQIREFIEPPAAAEAAVRLRPDEMAELLSHFEELETVDLPDEKKHIRHNQLDTKLHDLIIESLSNRRLVDIMDTIRSICARARIMGTPIRFTQSTDEHKELIRAIIKRDAAEAEQSMRRHLANTRQRLILSF